MTNDERKASLLKHRYTHNLSVSHAANPFDEILGSFAAALELSVVKVAFAQSQILNGRIFGGHCHKVIFLEHDFPGFRRCTRGNFPDSGHRAYHPLPSQARTLKCVPDRSPTSLVPHSDQALLIFGPDFEVLVFDCGLERALFIRRID
jgi:hypothetical protein